MWCTESEASPLPVYCTSTEGFTLAHQTVGYLTSDYTRSTDIGAKRCPWRIAGQVRSTNFFHRPVWPHHFSFSIPNVMAIFRRGPPNWGKITIFDQYLALGSTAHLLWATGRKPSVADWGDGVSASCTVGPIVR